MSDIINEDDIQAKFFNLDVELASYDTESILGGLEFNGFDPSTTFAQMIDRAAKAKVSSAELMKDITQILMFYVVRGTNFTRTDLPSRTKNVGILNKILSTMKKYSLVKNPKKPEDVTVSRLAAAFPHIVFLLLDRYKKERFGGHDSLPVHYQFPQAPALWSESEASLYVSPWFSWMFEMQKRINKKGKRSDATQTEVIEEFEDFKIVQEPIYEAMRTSDYSKKNKPAWRKQLGLSE